MRRLFIALIVCTFFVSDAGAQNPTSPEDLPRFIRMADVATTAHQTLVVDVRVEIYEPWVRAFGYVWWDPTKVIVFQAQRGSELPDNWVFEWRMPIRRGGGINGIWNRPPDGFEGYSGLEWSMVPLGTDFGDPGPWFPWQAYILDPERYARTWSIMRLLVHVLDPGTSTIHMDSRYNGYGSNNPVLIYFPNLGPAHSYSARFRPESYPDPRRNMRIRDARITVGNFVYLPTMQWPNPAQCPVDGTIVGGQVSVVDDSWGAVKALYR